MYNILIIFIFIVSKYTLCRDIEFLNLIISILSYIFDINPFI